MAEIHNRPDHAEYHGRTVRLVDDYPGDPNHESAEGMWSSLGWHVYWETYDDETGDLRDSGQVLHPVCTVEQIDTMTDDQILAEVVDEDTCTEERDAYASAIAYARGALADMRSIESSLEAALESWRDGDLLHCLEHLRAASQEESQYGDDPATTSLADDLLEDADD